MTATSYEKLLKLAHQRVVDGKGGLAASIAKMCLDARSELNREELALTFEILRTLIEQVEVETRRYIAEYLAARDDVPNDLISFLANDEINVAFPVLLHSVQLTDKDLIAVIDARGKGHQLAIAQRADLSGSVTSHLIIKGATDVVAALLDNANARLTAEGIARVTLRTVEEDALRMPLLRRRDIPLSVPVMMHAWVGEVLGAYIEENFDLSRAVADDAVSAAVDRLMAEKRAAISFVDEAGRTHDQLILGSIERAGYTGLADALSGLMRVDDDAVNMLIDGGDNRTIATLLRAFGLSRDQFAAALERLEGARGIEIMRERGELAPLVDFFSRLSPSVARNVVASWCELNPCLTH